MAKRFLMVWVTIGAIVAVLGYAIQVRWVQNIELARQHYIESSHQSTLAGVEELNSNFKAVYENLRTLAALPSIRDIDRHAQNFTNEGRVTVQQIYNNLAANVAVSEVYVVPIDLDPERLDPVTLKTEEPILMFDHLILNVGNGMSADARRLDPSAVAQAGTPGPEQVEKFEYLQFMSHGAWLREHYPTADKISKLEVPFISGPEVITCDNSKFIGTGNDKDRSGIIFSVPFFNSAGKLKGMVSAIVLSNALQAMMPADHLALVNSGNNFVTATAGVNALKSSQELIAKGQVDPRLIYSEVVPLPITDNRSPWQVWSGLSDDHFVMSADVQAANFARWQEFMTLAGIALTACICLYLAQVNLIQAKRLNQSLLQERDLAAKAETEATEAAETFQRLNDDISRLNNDLADKVKQLTEAQEDIVRKGKMAQLGNLVATVAHELRNPLGGVRTTAFLLRRKLKDSNVDVTQQLDRIEVGIGRCDSIISQLLDFSRVQPLITATQDMHAWMQELLSEEVSKLPNVITVKCVLGPEKLMVDFDPERLRRGVINLVTNAADAMLTKTGSVLSTSDVSPVITVELAHTKRGVEIIVTDNGPGIPPEVMAKLSEPLFTTKSFGTGLGLAAVRKVAELHGGGLDMASVPGTGATFTIWFPYRASATIAA